MTKHIISIGGGGFGRSIGDLKIEKYILSQSNKDKPNICFIPTATGDDSGYIENFYKAFDQLGANTSHIDFFKRTINLKSHISSQDIIYVGGGNTKSMLAVWREWSLDKILLNAYNNGIIMSGVSAGAICWFDKGITDSWANDLAILDCLNFVDGICCPHYDEEPERRPFVENAIKNNLIDKCIGIEGYAALHIKDNEFRSISFGDKKTGCYEAANNNDIFNDKKLNVIEEITL